MGNKMYEEELKKLCIPVHDFLLKHELIESVEVFVEKNKIKARLIEVLKVKGSEGNGGLQSG